MAITVTYKATSGDTVLCHGFAHQGVAGYYTGPLGDEDTTETEWDVIDKKPIGASSATPIDLGHGLHSFSLWVERRFATEEEARVFANSFAGTLDRDGVSLEISDTTAAKLTTYAAAALQKLTCIRIGISVDIYFNFKTSVPVVTDIT